MHISRTGTHRAPPCLRACLPVEHNKVTSAHNKTQTRLRTLYCNLLVHMYVKPYPSTVHVAFCNIPGGFHGEVRPIITLSVTIIAATVFITLPMSPWCCRLVKWTNTQITTEIKCVQSAQVTAQVSQNYFGMQSYNCVVLQFQHVCFIFDFKPITAKVLRSISASTSISQTRLAVFPILLFQLCNLGPINLQLCSSSESEWSSLIEVLFAHKRT